MAKTHAYGNRVYKLNNEGERLYDGYRDRLTEDEYPACPYCKEEASCGEVDYCSGCEVVIEGEVIIWTWKEWDKL